MCGLGGVCPFMRMFMYLKNESLWLIETMRNQWIWVVWSQYVVTMVLIDTPNPASFKAVSATFALEGNLKGTLYN